MENPKFQIFVGKDEQFYFHLRARNGEIVLASEGYTTKANAKKGIDSVKEHATHDPLYQLKTAADGQFYFVLLAANHEPIGTSEMYTTERAREVGMAAVKKVAREAGVEDLSVGEKKEIIEKMENAGT